MDSWGRSLLWLWGVFAVGCSGNMELNLIVYDPCDADQKPLASVTHVEVELVDLQSEERDTITWTADTLNGVVDFPPIEQAQVSVYGRMSDAAGNPGALVAATSVGPVGLVGTQNYLDLSVAIGRVGEFMGTTDLVNYAGCTSLGGERRAHSASLLPDGRVLFAGGVRPLPGQSANTYWQTTEFYLPTTGEFVAGPDMVWQRQRHEATVLDDGRVLITGGTGLIDVDGDPLTPSVEQVMRAALVFDPTNDSFEGAVQMQEAREGHSATLLGDGRVLIAGGTGGQGQVLSSTEIFDPLTGLTSAGPILAGQRAHHSAVRIGRSQVLLVGGQGVGALASTEFVDVLTGLSTVGPNLTAVRTRPEAILFPGQANVVLVLGGFSSAVTAPEGGVGLDTIELIILNSTSPSLSSVANCAGSKLTQGRGVPGVLSLEDSVVVVGGVGATGQVLGSAEALQVVDATSCLVNSIPLSDSLTTPRAGMTATPLVGGDILIGGGFAGNDGSVVAVGKGELYIRPRL